MPFVQRNTAGEICGEFSNAQPGYADEWLEETDAAVIAFRAAITRGKRVIYKADIWRRASDAEAEFIDLQLNAQPVRLRRMWQDSEHLALDDEMYPIVRAAFVAAFGEERTAELLAPST